MSRNYNDLEWEPTSPGESKPIAPPSWLASNEAEVMEVLREILNSGIEFDDERLSYKVMQIDKDLLSRIQKIVEEDEMALLSSY